VTLLFSYGTLQWENVQMRLFGRAVRGTSDALAGCELGKRPIGDPEIEAEMGITHYENLVFTGRADSRVAGTVLEITEEELRACDGYEADADYRRREVVLESGKRAWVYAFDGI